MMISPDAYEEYELKNKTQEQLEKKIRSLKRHVLELKRCIEHPHRYEEMRPGYDVQLHMTREYLARAVAAYEKAGGVYVPNKAERRAAAFDKAAPTIKKIRFMIGGFFHGYDTYTVDLTGETPTATYTNDYDNKPLQERYKPIPTDQNLPDIPLAGIWQEEYFSGMEDNRQWSLIIPMTVREYLERLNALHIGEWRRSYNDPDVMDGTQWNLTVIFENGHKEHYDGSNAFPFSFDELCDLVGAYGYHLHLDPDEYDEDEDEEN